MRLNLVFIPEALNSCTEIDFILYYTGATSPCLQVLRHPRSGLCGHVQRLQALVLQRSGQHVRLAHRQPSGARQAQGKLEDRRHQGLFYLRDDCFTNSHMRGTKCMVTALGGIPTRLGYAM